MILPSLHLSPYHHIALLLHLSLYHHIALSPYAPTILTLHPYDPITLSPYHPYHPIAL